MVSPPLSSPQFALGSDLSKKLVKTSPRTLVEGNEWRDKFWGDTGSSDSQNMLGDLLMQRRAWLIENAGEPAKPAAKRAPVPASPKAAAKRQKVTGNEEVIVLD